MEPTGWATIVVASIGMISAIIVAWIQTAKARASKQPWNGVERRAMEKVADERINHHIINCRNMAEVKDELKALRSEVADKFDTMTASLDSKLEAMRTFIIQLHGKP